MRIEYANMHLVKPNDVTITFVKIPAGYGCLEFWASETPVTVEQWDSLMFDTLTLDRTPKTGISFFEAKAFCTTLGKEFRLPTEAEYRRLLGEEPESMEEVAVFAKLGLGSNRHEVATKKPDRFGLYDVRGLCREWVETGSEMKAIMGGSWMSFNPRTLSLARESNIGHITDMTAGFRVVRTRGVY